MMMKIFVSGVFGFILISSIFLLITSNDPLVKLDAKVSMYGALMVIYFNNQDWFKVKE